MSKSNWSNAELYKPEINEKDKWDRENKISARVAVWVEGDDMACFGRYFHNSNHWSLEGRSGFDQSKLKWWQYITNPY